MNLRCPALLLTLAVLLQQPVPAQAVFWSEIFTGLTLVFTFFLDLFCRVPLLSWLLPYCNNFPNEPSEFNIDLGYVNVAEEDKMVYEAAAARWSEVITGDVFSYQIAVPLVKPYLDEKCEIPGRVDDIYICAVVRDFDREGVLAFGGPSWLRIIFSRVPLIGGITLNARELGFMKDFGLFPSVIIHEIGHVLGLGTLWDNVGVQDDTADCPYTGENAMAAYQAISGCDATVPVELEAEGSGSFCSHWSETCFGRELMTPAADLPGPLPISPVTVGSLEDLGYRVNYDAADDFTVADLDPSCVCDRRNLRGGDYHGKAFLLGDNAKQGQHPQRKLSEELREYALRFGKEELKRRKAIRLQEARSDNGGNPDGLEYVGDQVLSVLVKDVDEDGEVTVWSVIVLLDEEDDD